MYRLKSHLTQQPGWVVVVFAAITTFSVYGCMYGYRKAFTAAGFSDHAFWGIDMKIWLVSAQVLGYMFSKFYGIKFIAENKRQNRANLILRLIGVSWLALLLFGWVPSPYNIVFLFVNGFPLGMIWGLVFSFVEGRRATELMGAILASSFIFASGFAKTVGTTLLQQFHVPENWMPFVAGLLYLVPMWLFTHLLEAIPEPTEEDKAQRIVRLPMDKTQRNNFIKQFSPGIVTLVIAYVLLTILRDFRDNFSNEILIEIGLGGKAAIFTQTETPVAILVLLAISGLMLIKNNYRAFIFNHIIVMIGFAIAGLSTLAWSVGLLSPFEWFLAVGIGLYTGYIPINCLYFDRMIATFRVTANVGFIMYVADSFGYMGSVAVLFVKQFSGLQLSWSLFFTYCIYASCVIGIICSVYAMFYYKQKFFKLIPEVK